MAIATTNPATGQVEQTFAEHTDAEIEAALVRAVEAFADYRTRSVEDRAALVQAAAQIMDDDNERLARLAVVEMGKPLAQARAEVSKCATALRYYAEHAPAMLRDEPVTTEAESFKRYLPVGPVLAVMPWNFPFWQVVRFLAPAFMAGNVALLKHASNVPQCALAMEQVFAQAGFPSGVMQTLLIGSAKVEKLLADPRVAAATLTGSEGAGAAVGANAGGQIKKTVLELGGSDPFLVMASADLSKAVATAVKARLQNNGQSCIAAKRFIVHESVYADFKAAFVEAFARQQVGDPLQEDTDIGPIATEQGRADLVEQVGRAVEAGAEVLTGCEDLPGEGYFFSPGIIEIAAEQQSAEVFSEEMFGPVAMLFKTTNLDDAIELANATTFGLGSVIFTRDRAEAERAASELEAGATFVNSMVASDPRLPFGGVKRSGYGRELSVEGMREFMNLKTVSMTDL